MRGAKASSYILDSELSFLLFPRHNVNVCVGLCPYSTITLFVRLVQSLSLVQYVERLWCSV